MVATLNRSSEKPLAIQAKIAADLMHPDPKSLRAEATLTEIIHFFNSKNLAAAPVVNAAGRPIGVVSRSDLLIHQDHGVTKSPVEYFESADLQRPSEEKSPPCGHVTAHDLMTPAVFAVGPHTPISKVIADLVALHVHRLFVVDDEGLLIGVISAMDIVKDLA